MDDQRLLRADHAVEHLAGVNRAPSRSPPYSSSAPSETAACTRASIALAAGSSITVPTSVFSSLGSPRSRPAADATTPSRRRNIGDHVDRDDPLEAARCGARLRVARRRQPRGLPPRPDPRRRARSVDRCHPTRARHGDSPSCSAMDLPIAAPPVNVVQPRRPREPGEAFRISGGSPQVIWASASMQPQRRGWRPDQARGLSVAIFSEGLDDDRCTDRDRRRQLVCHLVERGG